jgi:autotransporter-associated beta strand protein
LNIGRLGTNDAAGTITAPTIAFGAGTGVVNFNQSNSTTLFAAISGNGAVRQLGAGTTTLTGANTYTGGTMISAGTLALGSANRLADTGAITVNGGIFDLGGFSETVGAVTLTSGSIGNGSLIGSSYDFQSGNVSASLAGNGVLTKTGAGTTTLTGANTYTGGTMISAGALQVGDGGTTGSLGSGAVSNNASLIMNRSDAVNLSNVISGTGGFTQAGAGTTTLTASNSFSGTTTINAGTLLANNTAGSALGSSTVTVQSRGTLGGNGSIAGPVTIASGGNLTPGSGGAGALSLRNGLTLQSGATTTFLINSAASFTSINILGNSIAYGGDLEFNIVNYTPADGNIFTLFNMTGGATTSGAFSNVRAGGLNFVGNNGVWMASSTSHSYEFSQSTGQLSVTAGVPEPSTYVLLAICALVMAVVWRRRNPRV